MASQLAFPGGGLWLSDGLPALPKKPRSRPLNRPSIVEGEQMSLELTFPTEEEFLVMTDEEIFNTRTNLLTTALSAIVDGRVSEKQRHEWMNWITSDEISPFSFVVCCIDNDARPEELRENFSFFIRRHHKKFAAEAEVLSHE